MASPGLDWWSAREAEWKEWEEEQKEEAEEEAARQLEETKKEGTEKKEEKRNWWESTASKEEQERRWAKTWLVKEPGKGSTETPEAPTEAPVEGQKKNKCVWVRKAESQTQMGGGPSQGKRSL